MMTRQECRERECSFFDEDIGCKVLNECRATYEDVESCGLAKITVEDGDMEEGI